jgi:hypothetical protein
MEKFTLPDPRRCFIVEPWDITGLGCGIFSLLPSILLTGGITICDKQTHKIIINRNSKQNYAITVNPRQHNVVLTCLK